MGAVGVAGLEPTTSASQMPRATNCATPRGCMFLNIPRTYKLCRPTIRRIIAHIIKEYRDIPAFRCRGLFHLRSIPSARQRAIGDLGRIRTCDRLLRRQLLYPAELPGQFGGEGGIRTPGTFPYVGFQDRCNKPDSATSP